MIKFIEENLSLPISPLGNVKFKLYEWQKEALKIIDNNTKTTVLVTARQIGSSSLLNAYALCYAMFKASHHVIVVGNKLDNAKGYCSDIQKWYEEIPEHKKLGVTMYKSDEIAFENNSSITFISPNANSMRGRSPDVIICHDFAFYSNQEKLMDCIYPCLTENNKLILQSCPNGTNYFYKMACGCKAVSTYDWKSNPNMTIERIEEIRMAIGERNFRQEFECSFEKEEMLKKATSYGFQSLIEYLRFWE